MASDFAKGQRPTTKGRRQDSERRTTKDDSMNYLLKTEPTVYSFADLQRDKSTLWDGVTAPAAVKHLREMPAGAKLVIYETGEQKSAVGTATVVSVEVKDPHNPGVTIKAGKP